MRVHAAFLAALISCFPAFGLSGSDAPFPPEYLKALKTSERGERAVAAHMLMDLARSRPDFHPAYTSLAKNASAAGGAEAKAVRDWLSGRRGRPGPEGACTLMALGLMERALGKDDAALAFFEESALRHPPSAAASMEAAYLFQEQFARAPVSGRPAILNRAEKFFASLESKLGASGGGGPSMGRALLAFTKGDLESAMASCSMALERQAALGEERGDAVCRLWRATFSRHAGMLREAIGDYEAAASFFLAQNDSGNAAEAFLGLGAVEVMLLENEKAREHLEKGASLYRETAGAGRGEATARIQSGILSEAEGDFASALRLYGEAARAARRLGDSHLEASALGNAAKACQQIGLYGEARASLQAAAKIFEARGDWMALGNVLFVRGALEREAGHADEARAAYEGALEIFERVSSKRSAVIAQANLADSALASGKAQEAEALFRACAKDAEEFGDFLLAAQTRQSLSEALSALERWEEAAAEAHRALEACEKGQLREIRWRAEQALGGALAGGGDSAAALTHMRRAVGEVESLRGALGSTGEREGFLAGRLKPYENLAALLLEPDAPRTPEARLFFYPEIVNSLDSRREAFLLSERMRARGMLERLGEARLAARGGASTEILSRLRALQARLEWLNGRALP
jgi:tetratricopeptide (TPR) repeat protein